MRKEILIIYDNDVEYATALASYINQVSEAVFSTAIFTEIESLIAYTQEFEAKVVLVSENLLCKELTDLDVKLIVFTEDESGRIGNYDCIKKYQSGDHIIREVTALYANIEKKRIGFLQTEKCSKIIGVYSPVHRSGVTTFALTMSNILGKNSSVIYVNFEDYSGLQSFFGGEYIGDMSDLLFFFLQKAGDMQLRGRACIHRYLNFDYIPPMSFSSDIRNISLEQWQDFLMEVATWNAYDYVVLDLGNVFSDIFSAFSFCDKVYIPYVQDRIAEMKMKEFHQRLEAVGNMKNISITEFSVEKYDELIDGFDDTCFSGGRYYEFVNAVCE